MFSNKKQVAVLCRDPAKQKEIEKALKKHFKIGQKGSAYVVCHGGDGTLLIAERLYPGIPKLLCKDSAVCNKCEGYDHPLGHLFERLAEGKFDIDTYPKLHARWERRGKVIDDFTCTNEFNIRNQLLFQALRFNIYINGDHLFDDEIIGDGAVICTPFGSSAYYHAITKSDFDEGIGIGLNNVRVPKNGVHTGKDKTITVEITRMPADFAVDNDPNIHTLEPGDQLIINTSAEQLKLIKVNE